MTDTEKALMELQEEVLHLQDQLEDTKIELHRSRKKAEFFDHIWTNQVKPDRLVLLAGLLLRGTTRCDLQQAIVAICDEYGSRYDSPEIVLQDVP